MLEESKMNTKDFFTHTESLLNHVYWLKQDFDINPKKDHIASAINWTDIEERKHDFLKELVYTVSSWVYNKAKTKSIIDDRLEVTNGDYGNASSFLASQAFSKFRPGHPQGQFGELLLFNFIQYFFEAVALLRKQRITTSRGHERFGADAIHYKKEGDSNIIILGESKCYKSDYKFKSAFEKSLESINTTVANLSSELDLYTYDDFIEPELESIAKEYKAGTLVNPRIELVCLIAYNETKHLTGANELEIKNSIIEIIRGRCSDLDDSIYSKVNERVLDRINYIIFPIWQFDELLNQFTKNVGGK
jgi:hypothetical protein